MEPQLNTTQAQNAILYLRVSSEEQVENFSLGTQEEICRREALRRGFEVTEVFREEGRSAKTITGRPELLKLLEFCRRNRRNVDAVFVYRLDRISRQTQDYLAIRKKLTDYGITLVSANEPTGNSPTDKLLETIMASFAQHDIDVRSERTKNGLRARFLSGLCTGKVPIGYLMQHGSTIKDEDTFDKMKKAWDLMSTGTKSLAEMATIMNDWGIRKVVSGKEYRLRPQTVDRLFHHKFYMGILTSKKYPEEIKGQHEPMITEKQFYKVQAIIEGRNTCGMTIGKRLKDNPDFPLRRVIKCGTCLGPLSGGWSKGRSKRYAYYICKNRCGAASIAVKTLDDSLIQFLNSINPTNEQLEIFLMVLKKVFNQSVAGLMAKREKADQEIVELKELRQKLVLKNLKGTYTDDVYQEQSKVIGGKIANAEVILGKTIFDKYNIDDVNAFMRDKFKDLGKTYKKSNIGERRVLLGSICPSGLSWQDSGLSNQQFSPEYQAIRSIKDANFAMSTA
ncbi:MAG TPA: recombinase family protein [Candidatus Saccharimonadales bacterium]|nr:recombinase family protein [Candidatus Saccharimonadales bacterium]